MKTVKIVATVFSGLTLGGLTLKVPVGSVPAYESADVWSDFGTTEEVDFEFTKVGVNYVVTNTEVATVAIAESSCYTANSGVFALTEVGNATITYATTAAFEDCTELTAFQY